MVNRLITEGNKIDFRDILIQTQEKDGVSAKEYASQVLDIEENGNLRVLMPIVHGRLIPLSKGKKYEACFYTAKGLYQGDAVIIDRFKTDNIYTMEIELVSDLIKYQRRQYYRLEKILPMQYTLISQEEFDFITANSSFPERLMELPEYYSGYTADISGGGLRFTGKVQAERGVRIIVVFEIKLKGKAIKYILPATVIMSFELPDNPGRFEHRVEFNGISNEYRELLIKYIFEEERKFRKNNR